MLARPRGPGLGLPWLCHLPATRRSRVRLGSVKGEVNVALEVAEDGAWHVAHTSHCLLWENQGQTKAAGPSGDERLIFQVALF